MSSQDTLQARLGRLQRGFLSCGVLALLLCLLFGSRNPWQGYHSYLFAYVFWMAIPLGCLAVLMVHHMTGGWWGLPIRRLLEAGTRTMLLMTLLFVPILVGLSRIYPWTNPAYLVNDRVGHFKWAYLHPGPFTVRAVIYFAILLSLVFTLNKWSREQDRTGDPALADRMNVLSGPGLVLWSLIVTGAAFDWVMSLEPRWFSTIYGMVFIVVECLVALSFVLFLLRMLSDYEPLKDCVKPKDYVDLGNLVLTFVMLWAYLSFSQFLIIWSGNLKDEIPWYRTRAFGGWAAVAVVLIVLHFFVPFFLLLQRGLKRKLRTLSWIAAFMVALTLVDIYWLVVPAYEKAGPRIHPLDILAVVGIGGLWVGAYFWELKKLPLLPVHDPRFEGVLEHEHGD
ncbi:MAG: hypothetical protein ACRD52_08075 [Candidatus Acidiferrales bacterium]